MGSDKIEFVTVCCGGAVPDAGVYRAFVGGKDIRRCAAAVPSRQFTLCTDRAIAGARRVATGGKTHSTNERTNETKRTG